MDCLEDAFLIEKSLRFDIKGKKYIDTPMKYYFISPTIVKYFGKTKIFNVIFKNILDKFVNYLKDKGYKDIEYKDR